jgi:DNA-binding XRE family transcriptional regulator
MKIEKLYKLTLNYDYTENDKMVFKYAFDMLFDMGLERNKAETIKFIQVIIDEGYFIYKERSRKMDMSFAYNLNLARKRCGFTQTDMSKKLHIDRTTYTKWKTAKSEPSIDNIKRLVKKLDVSYDHLFLLFQDKKTVKKINEIVKDKIRF